MLEVTRDRDKGREGDESLFWPVAISSDFKIRELGGLATADTVSESDCSM